MKNNNDVDDGVYDWNTLNGNLFLYDFACTLFIVLVFQGGRGWEIAAVCVPSRTAHLGNLLNPPQQSKNQMLTQVPVTAPVPSPQPDRRRDLQHRDSDRRRVSKVRTSVLG